MLYAICYMRSTVCFAYALPMLSLCSTYSCALLYVLCTMPICYMVYTYLTKTVDTVCTECTILYYVLTTGNIYMLDARCLIFTVPYISG